MSNYFLMERRNNYIHFCLEMSLKLKPYLLDTFYFSSSSNDSTGLKTSATPPIHSQIRSRRAADPLSAHIRAHSAIEAEATGAAGKSRFLRTPDPTRPGPRRRSTQTRRRRIAAARPSHGLGRRRSGLVRPGDGSSHSRRDPGSASRCSGDCCPGAHQRKGQYGFWFLIINIQYKMYNIYQAD